MKKITIGISALALALTGVAYAAPALEKGHDITRAEAKERAEKLFEKLDVNHDGKLDKADRTARENAMFDKIDANHDGSISRDEFVAAHDHMGPRGPQDGAGAPPPAGAPTAPGKHDRHGPRGHWRQHGFAGFEIVGAILHQADPNHTGTITKDAFVNGALALFDKADTNHDGKLDKAERRAAMAKMHPGKMRMHHPDHGGHDHGGPAGDMPPPPPAN